MWLARLYRSRCLAVGLMAIEVEYVQHIILLDAAAIANRLAAQEEDISQSGFEPTEDRTGFVSGELFRADPIQSRKGGLTLSIDPFIFDLYSAKMKLRLREIGKQAIKEALVNNQEQFVGLILGEAREGRNYFDRFVVENQQTRLF
jgi:hypothetical protein